MTRPATFDWLGAATTVVSFLLLVGRLRDEPVGYGGALMLFAAFVFVASAGLATALIGWLRRFTALPGWAAISLTGLGVVVLAVVFAYGADRPWGMAIVAGGAVLGRFGREPGGRLWRDVTVLLLGVFFLVSRVM